MLDEKFLQNYKIVVAHLFLGHALNHADTYRFFEFDHEKGHS
jgi:hypothetical protein